MANHTWQIDNKEVNLTDNSINHKLNWEGERYFSFELFGKKYTGEVLSSNTETGNLKIKINHRIFEVSRKRPVDEIVQTLGLDKIVERKMTLLKSPMPGKVLEIFVEEGQEIKSGEALFSLEAMKMENRIKAEGSGVIKKLHMLVGQTVEKDAILIEFE